MPDEQIASGSEIVMKLVHELFLSRTIEIDHDVSAENQVKRALDGEMIVHQIETPECNRACKMRFHFEEPGLFTSPAKKVTFDDFEGNAAKAVFVVQARHSLGENTGREVGGQNFVIPLWWDL